MLFIIVYMDNITLERGKTTIEAGHMVEKLKMKRSNGSNFVFSIFISYAQLIMFRDVNRVPFKPTYGLKVQ